MKSGLANNVFYEAVPVRREIIEGQVYVVGLDVAKAIGYENPSKALSDVLTRNAERFEGYTLVRKLRSQGQMRSTTLLSLKGVVAFCMLSGHPNAIPFQRWADQVLSERIEEIPQDIRMVARVKRVRFTDELKARGITRPVEYAKITVDMKEAIGIDKTKPKNECDLIEVMKIAVSEDLARINMIQNQASGYVQCHDESVRAGRAIQEHTKPRLS